MRFYQLKLGTCNGIRCVQCVYTVHCRDGRYQRPDTYNHSCIHWTKPLLTSKISNAREFHVRIMSVIWHREVASNVPSQYTWYGRYCVRTWQIQYKPFAFTWEMEVRLIEGVNLVQPCLQMIQFQRLIDNFQCENAFRSQLRGDWNSNHVEFEWAICSADLDANKLNTMLYDAKIFTRGIHIFFQLD